MSNIGSSFVMACNMIVRTTVDAEASPEELFELGQEVGPAQRAQGEATGWLFSDRTRYSLGEISVK